LRHLSYPVLKPTVFCDSILPSLHHTLGLHGGVGVVDCCSRQGYKVSVMAF
jgi:hypothetical protein